MARRVLFFVFVFFCAAVQAETVHITVARTQYNDSVVTLQSAIERVKSMTENDDVVIELEPGLYYLEEPIVWSNLTVNSVSLQARNPDGVHSVGGRLMPNAYRMKGGRRLSNFLRVDDPATLDRLDPDARGKVYVSDLTALGVTDFGTPKSRGIELFYEDQPMQIARWPNDGFTRIAEPVGGEPVDVRGTKGDKIGKWNYDGDRPKRWADETQGWLYGYWFWDWSSEHQKIKAIDTDAGTIEVDSPYHNYGYRKGQWYYALNILAELDRPGEWYVDADAGKLYFWPPGVINQSNTYVSVLHNAIELNNTNNVTIEGITFEGFRDTIVRITGGTKNEIAGCTFRNSGGDAVSISDGEVNGVVDSDIYDIGGTGIRLTGGDRQTLNPSRHYAVNNHIREYARLFRMYRPAIAMNGVGQRAAHNLIHNAPHMAVQFSGNDHLIEYNEIHSVSYESNDAGAIYAGRDWTQRGTVIRHNYLHHINGFENKGCVGVYLDDMFSGTHIYGNVFHDVTRAAFIGGGRDNIFENNLFVDCRKALHIDARATNWASYHVDTTMTERLNAMPYRSYPWKSRYPELLGILEDEPAAPKGNQIQNNIFIGENWNDVFKDARDYVNTDNNFLEDKGIFQHSFIEGIHEFRIDPQSTPATNGFRPIPLREIGLYHTNHRHDWPPKHQVRPNP